jgi:hypothetical protein
VRAVSDGSHLLLLMLVVHVHGNCHVLLLLVVVAKMVDRVPRHHPSVVAHRHGGVRVHSHGPDPRVLVSEHPQLLVILLGRVFFKVKVRGIV